MTRPSDPTVEAVPLSEKEPVCIRIARRIVANDRGWSVAERERLALAHLPDILATLDRSTVPDEGALRDALDDAIEGLLGTPRPPSSGPVEDIKAWELAHWRLVTAYGAYRGDHEMCPVPSSVTGQPCLLRAGHPQDSAARFHRYAAATPKDESDAPLDVELARPEAACPDCGGVGYTVTADPLPSGEPGEPYQVRCYDPRHDAATVLRAALEEDR